MFHGLVADLRARGPLERDEAEVGALLAAGLREWSPASGLLGRPGAYTRTCAYRDVRFEVLLLNWAPGAVSAIHDHGDQHCWMIVLDGRLQVRDYARLDGGDVPGYAYVEARGSRLLERGDLDLRAGRFDLHRVGAPNDAPAVSLHLYCRPLESFFVYDDSARRCASVRGTYDDVLAFDAEAISR